VVDAEDGVRARFLELSRSQASQRSHVDRRNHSRQIMTALMETIKGALTGCNLGDGEMGKRCILFGTTCRGYFGLR
jgi:hypothetical protein